MDGPYLLHACGKDDPLVKRAWKELSDLPRKKPRNLPPMHPARVWTIVPSIGPSMAFLGFKVDPVG